MSGRDDVTPNFKEQADCECGMESCTLWGTLGRPRRDGKRHVKGCTCLSCRGKRNRAKGDSKARSARKTLAIGGVNSRHEELFGGHVRVEMKAGGIIAPAYTAFVRCEQQSDAQRPTGDPRPFAAVFMPDGTRDGVVVMRLSKVRETCEAILENFEGGGL